MPAAAAGLGLSTERVHQLGSLYLGAVTHQLCRSGERAEQSQSKEVDADERRVRQFEGRSDRGDIAAALT